MKKTLIALAVAASAAVSGSAMAWTANGTGDSVDLGGTLKPVDVVTPWEVKVGAAVNDLNADIRKGDTTVDIPVNKAIPVLGIRNADVAGFVGQPAISPQISYGNAVNVDAFKNSRVPLTLEVKDATNSKIGTLTTRMGASAKASVYNTSGGYNGYNLYYSSSEGFGFFGGLPKSADLVANEDIAIKVMPEVAAKYTDQGVADKGIGNASVFGNEKANYSAYYASGIEQGQSIKITLDTPAGADAIDWNASLPVTVSYQ
ncbi:fimbrial protein [Escherichia coli]|nr:fimbrial protein [Escherichia coli]